MIKILVTGGSGFIGTNLIDYLINKGYNILNIDIAIPKKKEQMRFWKKVDINDYDLLESSILHFAPDYVIHLAARTDLNGKDQCDYSTNIEGVQNLVRILDKVDNLERVIFTSSMYVCRPGYRPVNDEDYNPHTEYGISKVKTEQIIKSYNPHYTWSLIRPTSIWGPYFGEPYNLFFTIVLSRKYFHMGKRACKKTYGYIDNTIYQIDNLLKAPDSLVNKKVFYLGDYIPYDITEWSNEIAAEAGFSIPRIPYFIFKLGAWLGDSLKIIGIKFPMTSFRLRNMTTDNIQDISLIQSIAPDLPVQRIDGVGKTINWIRKHKA